MDLTSWPVVVAVACPVVGGIIGGVYGFLRERKASQDVLDAEQEAFAGDVDDLDQRCAALAESHPELGQEAIAQLLEANRAAIATGRLFNLYGKQIEKYQQQTRTRATWSFAFAIVAMFAGLGFVFWGGRHMLSQPDAGSVTAGSLIAAIGGSVSAYITKTFLRVHEMSLSQLNHYYRQPVTNDHILMAQRLADEVDDPDTRKKAYDIVISSIAALIRESSPTRGNAAGTETDGSTPS